MVIKHTTDSTSGHYQSIGVNRLQLLLMMAGKVVFGGCQCQQQEAVKKKQKTTVIEFRKTAMFSNWLPWK